MKFKNDANLQAVALDMKIFSHVSGICLHVPFSICQFSILYTESVSLNVFHDQFSPPTLTSNTKFVARCRLYDVTVFCMRSLCISYNPNFCFVFEMSKTCGVMLNGWLLSFSCLSPV